MPFRPGRISNPSYQDVEKRVNSKLCKMADSTMKPLARCLNHVPLTIWLVLMAAGVFCWPCASHLAEYDRSLVAAGEFWRIVTCHLTHWNLDHLLWDTFALAVLGVMCERRTRAGWLACLGVASVAIPTAILFLQPEMATYRGLSGLDTALFATLAVLVLHEKWSERDWKWLAVICALLAGFAGKMAFELTTGGAIFVDTAAGEFTPAPLAHLVGVLTGGLVGVAHETACSFKPKSEASSGMDRPHEAPAIASGFGLNEAMV